MNAASNGDPATTKFFAAAMPSLSPGMLRPRWHALEPVFPFDAAEVHYFYLARNAIFALAAAWGLAGREVLFPAYFHGVELDALCAAGVEPAFYPVHTGMRVDADEVVSRITPKTRAVYLIHYLGIPGPVRELAAACSAHGIPLIEDCALALLSKLDDQPLGSFGDAAIFCLYKSLPVPNGGALVVARGDKFAVRTERAPLRAALSTLAAALRNHYDRRGSAVVPWVIDRAVGVGKKAATKVDMERVDVGSQEFDVAHARLGMNRLVHLILAGLPFSAIAGARHRNFTRLAERLRPLGASMFEELDPGVCPLFFPIVVRDKAAVLRELEARGIQAINFWSLSSPRVPDGAYPEVDAMRRTVVELPCHQDLTPQHMDRIADAVLALRDLVR